MALQLAPATPRWAWSPFTVAVVVLAGAMVAPALAESPTVSWTPEERAYLDRRGPIRMCVAPDWMSIEGVDAKGRHVGIGADFLQLMARHGGLRLELVPARTWEESYALGQRRECDIFSMLMDSPSRRAFLDFTTPYLEIPAVVATSADVPFVANMEHVLGEPLGLVRGFAGIELLRLRYPGIHLVEVESYEVGLEKVRSGELFGMLGNMISIGYLLQEGRIRDLKIAGRIGSDSLMSVATRNDEPMLRQVFQKLVESIQPRERQAIMNRWMPVRFEQGFDYRLLWRALAVFVLVAGITLFWAARLRRVNGELKEANQRLAEISRRDPLTGLYNRMHFDDVVASTLRHCSRDRLLMTLAVIDLDHFKAVNDTHGHAFGDACLRQVADLLSSTFRRTTDTAIRYGGEELVVVCVGGERRDAVEQLEGFRRAVERSPVSREGSEARLTVSIGVWSEVPSIGADSMQPLREADAALYRAKGAGRNRLAVAGDPPPHETGTAAPLQAPSPIPLA